MNETKEEKSIYSQRKPEDEEFSFLNNHIT